MDRIAAAREIARLAGMVLGDTQGETRAFIRLKERMSGALYRIANLMARRADSEEGGKKAVEPAFLDAMSKAMSWQEVDDLGRMVRQLASNKMSYSHAKRVEVEALSGKFKDALEAAQGFLKNKGYIRWVTRKDFASLMAHMDRMEGDAEAFGAAAASAIEQMAGKISASGFSKTVHRGKMVNGEGEWADTKATTVVLDSGAIRLMFRMAPSSSSMEEGVVGGSGTTMFDPGDGNWRTFDRRGIGDSFYFSESSDLGSIVRDQVAKVDGAIERIKRSVSLPAPFGRWSLTPEAKDRASKLLGSGKSYDLMPHGMGTGYRLSTKRDSFSRPGSGELARFFGVSRIFYSEFDAD